MCIHQEPQVYQRQLLLVIPGKQGFKDEFLLFVWFPEDDVVMTRMSPSCKPMKMQDFHTNLHKI